MKVTGDPSAYLQARAEGMAHEEVLGLWTRIAEREGRRLREAGLDRHARLREAAERANAGLQVGLHLRSRLDLAAIYSLVDNGVDLGTYAIYVDQITADDAVEAARAGAGSGYFVARRAGLGHRHILEAVAANITPVTYRELRCDGRRSGRIDAGLGHADILSAFRSGATQHRVEAALRAGAIAAEALEAAAANIDMGAYVHVRCAGRSHRFAVRLARIPSP